MCSESLDGNYGRKKKSLITMIVKPLLICVSGGGVEKEGQRGVMKGKVSGRGESRSSS